VETPANAFYDRLNQILDEHKFDLKVERLCQKFYKISRDKTAPTHLYPSSFAVHRKRGNMRRPLICGAFYNWEPDPRS